MNFETKGVIRAGSWAGDVEMPNTPLLLSHPLRTVVLNPVLTVESVTRAHVRLCIAPQLWPTRRRYDHLSRDWIERFISY